MNIHPLFVHFPIGILSLYVLFEIARFRFLTKQSFYFELKAVLVVFGTIAAFLAASTGDMAEELAEAGKNTVVSSSELALVQVHVLYAMTTVIIFSILAGGYIFAYCQKKHLLSFITKIGVLQKLAKFILHFSIIFALAGMITMTITGALGASIVYGPEIDPAVNVIYNLVAPTI